MEIDAEQHREGSSFAEKMADETRPRRVVLKRTIACIPTPIPLAGAPDAAVLRSRIHRQNVVSHRVVTSLNEFAKEFVQHGSRSIVSRLFEFRSTGFRPVSYSPRSLSPTFPSASSLTVFPASRVLAAFIARKRWLVVEKNSSNGTRSYRSTLVKWLPRNEITGEIK